MKKLSTIEEKISIALGQFDNLDDAVIDTCSLIYMTRCGYMELLSSQIGLHTIPEVAVESGISSLTAGIDEVKLPGSSTDEKIVSLAKKRNIAVISDDRKVLLAAKKENLSYFNSLMMLLYLLNRGNIGVNDYFNYRKQLTGLAHYGVDILCFAAEMFKRIHMKQAT